MRKAIVYLVASASLAAVVMAQQQPDSQQESREARRQRWLQRMGAAAGGDGGAAPTTQPSNGGGFPSMSGGGFPTDGGGSADDGGGRRSRRGGGFGFGGPGGGFGGPGGGFRRGPSGPTLPTDFAVLNTRSIFAKDRRSADAPAGGASGPETSLALRGAAVEDGSFTAFIEDTARHDFRRVRVGDPIGQGRCTGITLNSIQYEADGNTRQIDVGYSLAGTPAAVVADAGPGGPGGPDGGRGFGGRFGGDNPSANRNFLPGGAPLPNMTPEQMQQMRERFQNMTPEQREQMRQQFRSGRSRDRRR